MISAQRQRKIESTLKLCACGRKPAIVINPQWEPGAVHYKVCCLDGNTPECSSHTPFYPDPMHAAYFWNNDGREPAKASGHIEVFHVEGKGVRAIYAQRPSRKMEMK